MAIIRKHGENKTFINKTTIDVDKAITEARKRLRILSHGVKEGMQKGKNVIPDHTLALSFSTDKSAYPNVGRLIIKQLSLIFVMRLLYYLLMLHVVLFYLLIKGIR